jgi:hypothetical protein
MSTKPEEFFMCTMEAAGSTRKDSTGAGMRADNQVILMPGHEKRMAGEMVACRGM